MKPDDWITETLLNVFWHASRGTKMPFRVIRFAALYAATLLIVAVATAVALPLVAIYVAAGGPLRRGEWEARTERPRWRRVNSEMRFSLN